MSKSYVGMYVIAIAVFFACSKTGSESGNPPPAEEECTAAEQSGIESLVDRDTADETTYGGNFKKTYNAEGKVERLELVIAGKGKQRFNLDYTFTYEGNMAHTTRQWKIYKLDHNGTYQLVATENWNYNVVFNEDGYATKGGGVNYQYENGKLVSGADVDNILSYNFEYDEHGNIIKIKQFTSYGYRSLTYDYDYSKEAKNQMYLASGSWINAIDLTMLEVMGWVPLQPKHLRTMHWLKKYREEPNTDSTHAKYTFTDHEVTDGKLMSFRMKDGGQLDQVVQVNWNCTK